VTIPVFSRRVEELPAVGKINMPPLSADLTSWNCSAGERVIVNPFRIKSNKLNELESSLVLCYTERGGLPLKSSSSRSPNVMQNDKASIDGTLALPTATLFSWPEGGVVKQMYQGRRIRNAMVRVSCEKTPLAPRIRAAARRRSAFHRAHASA
jgi:hypothetical protein